MSLDRRYFLRGLFVAPFVARAEWLMPVKPLPTHYMVGDLIRWRPGVVLPNTMGLSLCAEPVCRVGRDFVVVSPGFGSDRPEYKVPAHMIDLFHGLPGNRVNNPSARSRLMQKPGSFALCYPEDLSS